MRKATILIVLVAVGLAYGASETWKTKPYQQWDQKDIKEILTSSPWVKSTTVTATWTQSLLGVPGVGGQNPQNQTAATSPQRPGSMGGGSATQPNNPQQPSTVLQGSEVRFFMRWSSAQTIREAVARDAVLNGRSSEAQAEQYVNQTPTTYQVLVYGPDMTPFTTETNDTLKSKAYIEVKPSKEKVSPSSVEIVKDMDGKKIQSVLF